MKRILSLIAMLAIFSNIMAQIPLGINYQAVIRDASGNIISNEEIALELSIQDNIGTDIWTETHIITTNQFGLVSLVVGQGTRTGGTSDEFSSIDWSTGIKKLHTVITYASEKIDMGTSEIWSIPYSMVSKNAYNALEAVNAQNAVNSQNALSANVAIDLAGDLSKLNVVEDVTGVGEEPLFEVKNNTGQTIFAVYNEGVEVYVNDTGTKGAKGSFAVKGFGEEGKAGEKNYLIVNNDSARIYIESDASKGVKGGFAVGSFSDTGTKGTGEEYLRITRDSTRIYINDIDDVTKGSKGSFAVKGFETGKSDIASYFDINLDTSELIVNPAENRILWYPYSNAFLAGRVFIEDPNNVGENSFATGYESRAKGDYSQAMGYQAYADGLNSTSIGQNSLAKGDNSYAFGQGAEVFASSGYAVGMGATVDSEGTYGYALGHDAVASAASSYAIGASASTTASGSYAIGAQAKANGLQSYAIGRGAIASGIGSFAFGSAGLDSLGSITDVVQAIGNYSVAIGQGARASSEGSIAIGIGNTANNKFATAMGYQTYASGYGSFASGSKSRANGQFATAMGYNSVASGSISTALGWSAKAYGHGSFAAGYYTEASNFMTTAMGVYSVAEGHSSLALGNYITAESWAETVVGTFNTDYTPIATGYPSPTDRLFVVGNGTNYSNKNDALIILKNGTSYFNGVINPYTNNTYSLGSSSYRWTTVYATNGTINTSDARYKTNIEDIENSLDKIMLINGVRYNWNKEEYPEMNFDDETHLGVLAQEVEQVLPELIYTDENGYKSVSYEKLTPVLIEAVKEQQGEIEQQQNEIQQYQTEIEQQNDKINKQEEKITSLINKNEELLSRIEAIEAMMNL